jgi:Ca2+-binding RTX toxin-like protein
MPTNTTHTIALGSGTTTIANFKGIGRGVNPTAAVLADADTLNFVGSGLTVDKLQLFQIGDDVVVTFEGVSSVKVILQNIKLDELDNLTKATGATVNFAGMLFDGDTTIKDSFDVVDSDRQISTIFNPNTVTFLNDLNNTVNGKDRSNDIIRGLGGNDVLYGLSGNDALYGDNGNDSLDGGDGNDSLYGGTGDDAIVGGAGDDSLLGGEGIDILSGGIGNDSLYGEAGDDQITGGLGTNKLDGGAGIDTAIYLGTGYPITPPLTFRYDASSAWNVVTSSINDQLVGIEKVSIIDFSSTKLAIDMSAYSGSQGSLKVNIDSGKAAVTIPGFPGVGIELSVLTQAGLPQSLSGLSVTGSQFNDTLSTTESGVKLFGGGGNDTITGGNNSFLYGEDGDDVFYGGQGNRTLNGGNGVDTASYSTLSTPITLKYGPSSSWNILSDGINDQLIGIEKLDITRQANVTIDMSDYSGSLEGVKFSGKEDYFSGLGLGVPFPSTAIITIPANVNSGQIGSSIELLSSSGLMFIGSRSDDNLSLTTANNIRLSGGVGNDELSGGSNAVVYGDEGDDILSGGFDSSLYGGEGNDRLLGGGRDVMVGGAGADSFELSSFYRFTISRGWTVDTHTIRDFNRYEGDKIVFKPTNSDTGNTTSFTQLVGRTGLLDPSLFAIKGSETNQALFIYDVGAGDLYYGGNRNMILSFGGVYSDGRSTTYTGGPIGAPATSLGYKIMHLDGGVILQASDILIQ